MRADVPGAERALRQASELARGDGVSRGRELTPALASVFGRSDALSGDDREAADALLARPTDNTPGQPGGPYTGPRPKPRTPTSASTGSSAARTRPRAPTAT